MLPGPLGPAFSRVYGASYAPLTSPYSNSAWWGRYFRRGLSVSQWDLEYIFYQLIYSCRSPQKVYKLTQHRKQTKNQWARDDPAFVFVMLGFLAISAIAFGVAYEYTSPSAYLWLILQAWLNFVGLGGLLATVCWAIANKYMRSAVPLPHSVEQDVEWLYAWDVHCNAYVPILALLFVAQYALLPLVMVDGFFATLMSNSLYAAAILQYIYITFSGYLSESSFSRRTRWMPGGAVFMIINTVCAPALPPLRCSTPLSTTAEPVFGPDGPRRAHVRAAHVGPSQRRAPAAWPIHGVAAMPAAAATARSSRCKAFTISMSW